MNCSQFTYGDPTEDKLEVYRTLIQKSREEGVKLILNSDADITYDVGGGSEFLEIYKRLARRPPNWLRG
ncbi:MAG: hypothetical protein ACFFCD_09935 [Promethearchaeota archaeon]